MDPFVLLILALITPSVVIVAWVIAVITRDARRRRRQRRRNYGLTEREALAAVAPHTEPIAVWPSRAPRNGSAYDYSE